MDGYSSPDESGYSPHGERKPLTVVRVVSTNLNFGCLQGRIEGSETPATVLIFHHRRQRLLGGYPKVGDLLGCEQVHPDTGSVYEPRVLMLSEEVVALTHLRRYLPDDITQEYFGIRRPLVRVDH